MNEEIKNVELKFACSANWEAMDDAEGGKHCDKCQKKVYDFTNSKADEFKKILAENDYSVCGRFNATQIAPVPIVLPLWKKWLSAAMVLISITWIENKAIAQKPNHKHIKQKVKFPQPVATMGDIQITDSKRDTLLNKSAPYLPVSGRSLNSEKQDSTKEYFGGPDAVFPIPPGGENKFKAFIYKNLDQDKALKPGRVNVTFIVEEDGSLSNIQTVGRHFDEGANKEAIRVMKLSPKWIPGMQNGKPVAVKYTVPIIFK